MADSHSPIRSLLWSDALGGGALQMKLCPMTFFLTRLPLPPHLLIVYLPPSVPALENEPCEDVIGDLHRQCLQA